MSRFKVLLLILLLILFAGNFVFGASAVKLEGEFKVGPAIILIAMLILFVAVGFIFKAKTTSDYWAAGRKISPIGSGAAIASNWMSAASFLGMAAIMYGTGYNGIAYVVGWTGGYVLLLILMAAQIRKFGKYTASDFIGDRYYSQGLRTTGAGITIFISFIYCVGQFAGIGLMFKWILGIDYTLAVLIGASVVVSYTLIAGMMGATKNMQIQYVIMLTAFLLPLVIMAFKYDYSYLLPQIGYGQLLTDITNGLKPVADKINSFGHSFGIMPSPEYVMPWDKSVNASSFQWFAICFSMILGTAGLPHVIQRFYVVPKIRDARWSVVWGLLFISLIYWSAPVYSAFGKVLSANPEVGVLAKDAIVVYTAQLGSVAPFIVGLLAAGAVSAAFSTVSGLLVSGASAFSHDIYFKVINKTASEKKQLSMARIGIATMGVLVSIVALANLALIAELVAIAFSLAAVTIFPLFLLGIWWSGSNKTGAFAGLIAGGSVAVISLVYFVVSKFGGNLPFSGFISYYLNPWYFAWIGAPLAITANIVFSILSKNKTPLEVKKELATRVHTE